jgi:hypothetical protein
MATRTKALSLYHQLLRAGSGFQSYGFRNFALRRAKEDFRRHRNETDQTKINELLSNAEQQLGVVKRQAAISRLYPETHFAVEDFASHHH